MPAGDFDKARAIEKAQSKLTVAQHIDRDNIAVRAAREGLRLLLPYEGPVVGQLKSQLYNVILVRAGRIEVKESDS